MLKGSQRGSYEAFAFNARRFGRAGRFPGLPKPMLLARPRPRNRLHRVHVEILAALQKARANKRTAPGRNPEAALVATVKRESRGRF